MISAKTFKRKVTRCLEDGGYFFADQCEQEEMMCVMNHFIDVYYARFAQEFIGIDTFKKYYLDHFAEYYDHEKVKQTIHEIIEEEKYTERENEDK